MTYFFIYKTINIINNKFYIGKHKTENLDDGYLGSGIALKRAIKKYGKHNFQRVILYYAENEEELNLLEQSIVDENLINDEMCYNIALGGKGGAIVLKEGHPKRKEVLMKIRETKSTKESRLKRSKITKYNHTKKKVGMYGKPQSDFQKQTASRIMKNRVRSEAENKKRLESLRRTLDDPNYISPLKNKPNPKATESIKIAQSIENTCPHCGKTMRGGNYFKYHGDLCKEGPNKDEVIRRKNMFLSKITGRKREGFYINNGERSMMWKDENNIPDGWVRGKKRRTKAELILATSH